jgi:hypothetical protein
METPLATATPGQERQKPADGSRAVDALASVSGLITSLLTGLVLWLIAVKTGFAFHKLTYAFIFPAGAFASGWAGASGYYVGYQLFKRRPGALLLSNIVASSLGTFFLLYYLFYLPFRIDAAGALRPISFWSFLDISIRASTIKFQGASTPKLGYFGYVTTGLEVAGFALGGLLVYSYLRAQPYCSRCAWRLASKGAQVRYSPGNQGIENNAQQVVAALRKSNLALALQEHGSFGSFARYADSRVRSVCRLHACKHCGQHVVSFALERRAGEKRIPIPQTVVEAVADGVLVLQK